MLLIPVGLHRSYADCQPPRTLFCSTSHRPAAHDFSRVASCATFVIFFLFHGSAVEYRQHQFRTSASYKVPLLSHALQIPADRGPNRFQNNQPARSRLQHLPHYLFGIVHGQHTTPDLGTFSANWMRRRGHSYRHRKIQIAISGFRFTAFRPICGPVEASPTTAITPCCEMGRRTPRRIK